MDAFSAPKIARTPSADIEYFDVALPGAPTAPPLVLLHGFPDHAACWKPLCALLPAAGLPFPRAVVPNLRGTGGSVLRDGVPRSGQQAALASDLIALMDALGIDKAYLCGMDWGGRAACIVAAARPERVAGLLTMGSGYNLQAGIARSPDVGANPAAFDVGMEKRWWYQYFLHSERGRNALRHPETRRKFCGELWSSWSPKWRFSAADLDAANAAWGNPDYADVAVQSYRHRHNSCAGDPALQPLEDFLAPGPPIKVPTVVLHGEADGVDVKPSAPVGQKFPKLLEKRVVWGAGHFIPQEAPRAVLDGLRTLVAGTTGGSVGKL
ncbi:putative epoxide hydrolase protein [Hyaloraphidium curvatum]|nr:putative epoxide hydrolase protein [Hyaloraphidium curvatum]